MHDEGMKTSEPVYKKNLCSWTCLVLQDNSFSTYEYVKLIKWIYYNFKKDRNKRIPEPEKFHKWEKTHKPV